MEEKKRKDLEYRSKVYPHEKVTVRKCRGCEKNFRSLHKFNQSCKRCNQKAEEEPPTHGFVEYYDE